MRMIGRLIGIGCLVGIFGGAVSFAQESVVRIEENWRFFSFLEEPPILGDKVIVLADFTSLLNRLNETGKFDEHSVRVIELDEEGRGIKALPLNFIKCEDFDPAHNAVGKIVWRAEGEKRDYRLYFDTLENGNKPLIYDRGLTANLLPNPGFEEGSPPTGWDIRETRSAFVDSTVAHSGRISIRCETTDNTPFGRIRSGLIRVEPHVRLHCSFYARAREATCWSVAAFIYWFDADKEAFDWRDRAHLPAYQGKNFDWKKFVRIIEVPPQARYFQLWLETGHSAGTTWFDDVAIYSLTLPVLENVHRNR